MHFRKHPHTQKFDLIKLHVMFIHHTHDAGFCEDTQKLQQEQVVTSGSIC